MDENNTVPAISNPSYSPFPHDDDDFSRFYHANREALETATTFLNDSTAVNDISTATTTTTLRDAVDSQVGTFSYEKRVGVILEGLEVLEKSFPWIHPIGATYRFVTNTLDLRFRETNRKVVMLELVVQSVVCGVFGLRHVRKPATVVTSTPNHDDDDDEGAARSFETQLQPLITSISLNIQKCLFACDAYLKKEPLLRAIKEPAYESRLADLGSRLMNDQRAFEKAVSEVTTAHHRQRTVPAELGAGQVGLEKLKPDMFKGLLECLRTPLELEVLGILEAGGDMGIVEGGSDSQGVHDDDGDGGDESEGEDTKRLIRLTKSDVGIRHLYANFSLSPSLSLSTPPSSSAPPAADPPTEEANKADQESRDHKRKRAIGQMIKSLKEEMAEDVDAMFQKNLALFRWKYDILSLHHVKPSSPLSEKKVTSTKAPLALMDDDDGNDGTGNGVFSGAHWMGSEIEVIKRKEGWGDVVPIETLIDGLKRYFMDEFTEVPDEDKWALKYVDIQYRQPLLEIISLGNARNAIFWRNVQMFVEARPSGWTPLQWLALWAAGWHVSVTNYKERIYILLRKMFSSMRYVLPHNYRVLDRFLQLFDRIDTLISSTRDARKEDRADPHLAKLVRKYDDMEENRLHTNLLAVRYELQTEADVNAIVAGGAFEKHFYRFLYLVLKHQLRVFALACHHIFGPRELEDHHDWTIHRIVGVADTRARRLRDGHWVGRRDAAQLLRELAFGMFQASSEFRYYDGKDIRKNKIAVWTSEAEETYPEAEIDVRTYDAPKYILHSDMETFFDRSARIIDPQQSVTADVIWPEGTPLQKLAGAWSGHMYRLKVVEKGRRLENVSLKGLLQFSMDQPEDDVHREGLGTTYAESFEVLVTKLTEDNEVHMQLIFSNYLIGASGQYDPEKQVITGTWFSHTTQDDMSDIEPNDGEGNDGGSPIAADQEEDDGVQLIPLEGVPGEDQMDVDDPAQLPITLEGNEGEGYHVDDNAGDQGGQAREQTETRRRAARPLVYNTFIFTRTPAALQRFRYTSEALARNPSRARWSFACNAVLRQVQQRLWTWSYFKARRMERQRFIQLSHQVALKTYAPYNPLTSQEKQELRHLREVIAPSDAALWEELKTYRIQGETWHTSTWLTIPRGGILCDGCRRQVMQTRRTCLTCRVATYTNNVDFCAQCQSPKVFSNFKHKDSHTLLKINYLIQDPDHAWLVPEGRNLVKRVRAMYSARNALYETGPGKVLVPGEDPEAGRPLICTYCHKWVTYPFLACVVCASDTFICMECDEQDQSSQFKHDQHNLRHARIIMHNITEEEAEQEEPKEGYDFGDDDSSDIVVDEEV